MRFRDIRTTEYKRVPLPAGAVPNQATPLRLSPFLPDGVSVRKGLKATDITWPGHNRRSRRAMGRVRPRRRLGGVALITKPWHPVEEEIAA